MGYRKVTYPCQCQLFRWPNDPRGVGAVPDATVKVRWMFYKYLGSSLSLAYPGPSSAIVIIAFPLDLVLFDWRQGVSGYGDYLIPIIPLTKTWQVLEIVPHALGFPNQTMLAAVTDLPQYPVGPP